jgi:hypothetical protein
LTTANSTIAQRLAVALIIVFRPHHPVAAGLLLAALSIGAPFTAMAKGDLLATGVELAAPLC